MLFCNIAFLSLTKLRQHLGKEKAQTVAIRCLGSPQATILYGKSALRVHPNKNCLLLVLHFRGGDSDSD